MTTADHWRRVRFSTHIRACTISQRRVERLDVGVQRRRPGDYSRRSAGTRFHAPSRTTAFTLASSSCATESRLRASVFVMEIAPKIPLSTHSYICTPHPMRANSLIQLSCTHDNGRCSATHMGGLIACVSIQKQVHVCAWKAHETALGGVILWSGHTHTWHICTPS